MLINRAVPYMLVSTLSLSLTGLFLKKLTEMLSVDLLTFLRLLMPALLFFFIVVMSKLHWPPRNSIRPIIVRGLCIAACQLCFIASLSRLSLVESSVLFATGPIFIAVLEKLLFQVEIKTQTKFSLVVTFIGVVLLAGDVSGIQFRPELLIGLASGVFSAGSQVSLFRASKAEVAPATINGWTFLIAAVSVLPILSISGLSVADEKILLAPIEHGAVWLLLCTLSVSVATTQIMRSKAYKLAQTNSQIAPLIFTSLLFSTLWQVLFFDQTFSNYQIAGVALIVTAAVMNNFAAQLYKLIGIASARLV